MYRVRIVELGVEVEIARRHSHRQAYTYARKWCESWLKDSSLYSAVFTPNCCYVYPGDQSIETGKPAVTITIVDEADDPKEEK